MNKLVEELLLENNKVIIDDNNSGEYITSFLRRYPKLKSEDPSFFWKKCGAISILFHEHLKEIYGIESKIIAGKVLDQKYKDTWMDVKIPELQGNIERKKRFGHAVVLVGNIVYDLSSLQFTKYIHETYPLSEFKKRWMHIDDTMFSNYDKKDYRSELREIL